MLGGKCVLAGRKVNARRRNFVQLRHRNRDAADLVKASYEDEHVLVAGYALHGHLCDGIEQIDLSSRGRIIFLAASSTLLTDARPQRGLCGVRARSKIDGAEGCGVERLQRTARRPPQRLASGGGRQQLLVGGGGR